MSPSATDVPLSPAPGPQLCLTAPRLGKSPVSRQRVTVREIFTQMLDIFGRPTRSKLTCAWLTVAFGCLLPRL